jgi:hypothetical protein
MKLPRTRTMYTLLWLKRVLVEISQYTTEYNDLFDETQCDWSKALNDKAEQMITTVQSIHRDEVFLKAGSNAERMLDFVRDIDLYITELLDFALVNVMGQHLLWIHHKFTEWKTNDEELRVVKSQIVMLLRDRKSFFRY